MDVLRDLGEVCVRRRRSHDVGHTKPLWTLCIRHQWKLRDKNNRNAKKWRRVIEEERNLGFIVNRASIPAIYRILIIFYQNLLYSRFILSNDWKWKKEKTYIRENNHGKNIRSTKVFEYLYRQMWVTNECNYIFLWYFDMGLPPFQISNDEYSMDRMKREEEGCRTWLFHIDVGSFSIESAFLKGIPITWLQVKHSLTCK